MDNIFKFLLPTVFLFTISQALSMDNKQQSTFSSKIFTYEDPVNAQKLHVTLKGDNWSAEDVKPEHIKFHIDLFGNATVMAGFADGQTRPADAVEKRINDSITNRFGSGSPHGLLVVQDDNKRAFMHIVAGGGDRAGTSEIAYAMMDTYWGKNYGKKVVASIVQEWAPEVYEIGHGIGLNPIGDAKIITAFQCFGGKPLEQLDATASPSNPASWRILDKLKFKSAKCDLASSEITFDFERKEFHTSKAESLKAMESELLELFGPENNGTLQAGKRYRMVDPDGKLRTVSKHARWDRMKYHFEKDDFAK